jgi:hypothetical protein
MRRKGGGSESSAVPIGALIGDLLRSRGLTKRAHPAGLAAAWKQAVGADREASTRVTGLRGGILTVEVASAALRCELETFYHEDLLDRLRVLAPKSAIRKIVFRTWGRR